MSEFQYAAETSEISDGEKLLVEIQERLVILLQTGNEYFCMDDVCTHDGGTLSDGSFAGHEIVCPRHGAKFDIRTGCPLTMPATQPTKIHQVKVDGNQILVKLSN